MQILTASEQDRAFLREQDFHIREAVLDDLLAHRRIYVLKKNEENIGWLRWSLFWDEIPFMNMLYVTQEYRRQGGGQKLVRFWERQMQAQGYDFVLTSSRSDEQGQHFFRKLGYRDAGTLLLQAEPTELLFVKYFP